MAEAKEQLDYTPTEKQIKGLKDLHDELGEAKAELALVDEDRKEAKKRVEGIQANIEKVLTAWFGANQPAPLFEAGKDQEPAEGGEKPVPPAKGEHLEVDIMVLENFGATHGMLEGLKKLKVQTFQDLDEWLGENKISNLKGITKAGTKKFNEAVEAFLADFYKDTPDLKLATDEPAPKD